MTFDGNVKLVLGNLRSLPQGERGFVSHEPWLARLESVETPRHARFFWEGECHLTVAAAMSSRS